MRKLGSLEGTGRVEIKGVDVGALTYSIDIWQEANGLKSAEGSAQGDMNVLAAAFNAGKAQLLLQTGGSVDFLVTRLGPSDAEIQISGPVPTF